jgi:diguanylate cyclase (GGDEF)-like protein
VQRLVNQLRLRSEEAVRRDTERSALLSKLEAMSRTDALTGLPNRRAWEEALPDELARAQRYGARLGVVMFDIDAFKAFNDANGHQSGDRLLKEAASAWRSKIRDTDFLARYGGDEFALILSNVAEHAETMLVERIRAATPEGLGCSAGVAIWDGREAAANLVARSDRALYVAKRGGRNRAIVDAGHCSPTSS